SQVTVLESRPAAPQSPAPPRRCVRDVRALLGMADRREARAGVRRHDAAHRGRSGAAGGEGHDPAMTARWHPGGSPMRRCLALAVSLSLLLLASCAHRGSASSPAEVTSSHDAAVLNHVESFYTLLLATRRPDLAGRYAMPPQTAEFDPLNEGELA